VKSVEETGNRFLAMNPVDDFQKEPRVSSRMEVPRGTSTWVWFYLGSGTQ
jgi:hypothetical protein